MERLGIVEEQKSNLETKMREEEREKVKEVDGWRKKMEEKEEEVEKQKRKVKEGKEKFEKMQITMAQFRGIQGIDDFAVVDCCCRCYCSC